MENSNSLEQGKTLLIGSDKAIQDLAQKDSASVVIVSDSHGDSKTLLNVFKNSENCDAMIFCGDGLIDLAAILNISAESNLFVPPVIACVKGNNDLPIFSIKNTESGSLVNVNVPAEQILTVASHKIFITHGHCYGINGGINCLVSAAETKFADVVIFGHSHLAASTSGMVPLVLNPGSVRLPRGGQPRTFAKLFLEKNRQPTDFVFFQLDGHDANVFKYPAMLSL